MHAVIVTGGKQYRVSEGQILQVEKLPGAEGEAVAFDKVLMVTQGDEVRVGAPYVEGGKVTAVVRRQGRGEKISIMKFRRRKHYQKRTGHRQAFTELQITGIELGLASGLGD